MKREDTGLQIATSILAYLLPLAQFFFGQLPQGVQDLFLFRQYFSLVSIFTAILAYATVLVVRAQPWFALAPLQMIRKRDNRDWEVHNNGSFYTVDEIKTYQASHNKPAPLKTITPANITIRLFVPSLILGFVVFMICGLFGKDVAAGWGGIIELVQLFAYVAFLVASVLAFAQLHLHTSGFKQWQMDQTNKYEKAVQLARQRDVFEEQKNLSLVYQKTDIHAGVNYVTFLLKVGDRYFVLSADDAVDILLVARSFDTLVAAEQFGGWAT